jgi:gliding motility-associated-like protein
MIKKFYVLFIIFSCLLISRLQAQINASPAAGCAPLAVTFTGTAGGTNPLWTFGDGNSSPVANPINTYAAPGVYTVHYSATVGGSPVNYTTIVTVYNVPKAAFTSTPPTKGCAPLAVAFASQSTGGGGSGIATYSWTFGDGGQSNVQNPNYTYNLTGQFDVQLKVTDQNGCSSSIKLTKYISTSSKPNPVIQATPVVTTSCTAPFTASFDGSASTSNSTTGSTLTYSWIFSNGNSSAIAVPPAQTYTTTGNFPVTLTVSDNNGCSNSTVQNVFIGNPISTFSVKDSVCKTVTFNPAGSTGIQTWTYGDGQSGSLPTHTYSAGGTYNVKLHVSQGSCFKDTTRTIFVEDPQATFSLAPTYSCSAPELVNMNNTSTGAVPGSTFSWTFATGTPKYKLNQITSTLPNPQIKISDQDTNRFTIDTRDVILNVSLSIKTPAGCTATLSKLLTDTIFLPTARIQPDKSRGCAPLTVAFSDSSISHEPIVNWTYIWGDGTPNVIANSKGVVNHTYTNPGIYQAKLVIVNNKGCTDTSYVIVIYVGVPPTPNFTVAPAMVCPNTPVVFTNTSTAPGNSPIDTWHYTTDGKMMSSCYADPNPTYSFTNLTGAQNITLVTCSRGCCDSIVKPNAITVKGPIAKYNTQMICNAPDKYTFNASFQSADNWTWNFGDGTIIAASTTNPIQHTYAATGDYQTTLIAHNNSSGCPNDTFKLMVHDKHIKAVLASDTNMCSSFSKPFDASGSVDVHTVGNNGYIWIWGDNTSPTISSNPVAPHTFASPGFYFVKLIVVDNNGCRDTTLSKKLKVSAVTAAFKPDHLNGCIPWNVNFTDKSTSDTTITSWTWNFGDGSPNSTLANPSHVYSTAALNYTVTLTTTNILGCSQSISKVLTPSQPNALFSASSLQKCAGDSIHFSPQVGNQKGYNWSFGDLGTSTATSPWHKYLNGGAYTVSLTVKDSIGCMATSTQNNYIQIQNYPIIAFTSNLDTAVNLCAPVVAKFNDVSTVSVFGSRQWNLGSGGPVVPSVSVSTPYQTAGTYAVTLIETSSFGCSDTLRKSYTIQQPKADFTLSPSMICKGAQVTFSIIPADTSDFYSYHWYFGDGHDTLGISPVSHPFNFHPAGGVATVTLFFWGSGKSCKTAVQHAVNIHQVIADFKRNGEIAASDTIHCLGITDVFTNTSVAATSYSWTFGDGSGSALNSPAHKYLTAGTYLVSLNIRDSQSSCVDTLRKVMIINPIPAIAARGGDTCLGKPIQLISSGGGLTYTWSPVTGLNAANIPNPIATPTVTTIYTVTTTDGKGCQNDTLVTVNVIQPIPHILFDTTIIIGQTAPLAYHISPAGLYTYVWTPTDSLSCKTCPNPHADPVVNTTYTLTVSDKKGCFTSQSTYEVKVLPETSLDVPTAFTPNGDGVNDIVYVRGWGIKSLLEFNIYNRWGELVFTTTDINQGWDGYYKGALQNVETYAWTARVETYVNGKSIVKKGFIKLLR